MAIKDGNPKLERMLALVDPSRRDALRKILLTAAYTAPAVSSFSLDSLAQVPVPVPTGSCSAANQTFPSVSFAGTVRIVGIGQVNGANPQPVKVKLDVTLDLCEGSNGIDQGTISDGPGSLVGLGALPFSGIEFEGSRSDTLGFAVLFNVDGPGSRYIETGQFAHTLDNTGRERLKGSSLVLIGNPVAALGASFTLECDYDLTSTNATV